MRKVLSCWECQVHKSGYRFSDSDLHLWTWRLSLIISNRYPYLFSLKWQIRFIPSEKMPAKYPTLNNSSISSKMYFVGDKSSAPSSYSCPSAPPQKSRRTSASARELCADLVSSQNTKTGVPKVKILLGLSFSCIIDLLKWNSRFCCTCPVAEGTVAAPGVWCPACLGVPPPRSFRTSIHQQHEPLLREEGR